MIPAAAAAAVAQVPAYIPSPDQGVWNLGPIPLRAYALLIVLGILLAVWIGEKRWVARGGEPGVIGDVALWAVPFGIVGGRLYHVISDNQIYFGEDGAGLVAAFKVWEGGLGIWGAIAFGGLGAWIATRRMGVPLAPLADAVAPGVILAQALGRWGNYANQELFGAPTEVPWALQIDPANRPPGFESFETFHPTFLYESLWNLGVFVVLIWADRRFRMGHGRVFALYVLLYTAGRVWIEALRIDTANQFFGIRLNVWTSVIVGLGALIYLVVSARRHPGREAPEELLSDAARAELAGSGAAGSPEDSGDATERAPGAATERAPGTVAERAPGTVTVRGGRTAGGTAGSGGSPGGGGSGDGTSR